MLRPFLLSCFLLTLSGAVNDWPYYRGPENNGVARGKAPLTWGEGKNIAWKFDIPGRGFSSPVIWGDKLFLTTAVPAQAPASSSEARSRGGRGAGGGAAGGVEHSFVVLCLDRNTGKKIWERTPVVATPHEGYHAMYGSFASNSPVTDGKRVYAFFGSRGLYAYDLDGKLIWKRDFQPMHMRLEFGEGVAPVIDGDRMYLKFDQEQGSHLLALDKNTGKDLWRVDREEVSSWSPPLPLTHDGRRELVVSASSKVTSYDPETGKVLWEVGGLGTNVIPAPVASQGLVYVMSGHRDPNLLAIRLGREGDLAGTDAVVWTNNRGNSYTASPVLAGGILYFITDNGMLSAFDATTGKAHYQQRRLPKPYSFKSSPVAADGKLYLATEDEDVVVVKMGPEFEVLATNTLPNQMFIATPAIVEGALYLRSKEALYCIREKD